MNRPALITGIRKMTTPSFLLTSIGFMILYLLLQAYITNHTLVHQTITGPFSLSYKVTLLYYTLTGYLEILPTSYLITTLVITFLLGISLALAVANYQKARSMGKMKMSFGGSSLVAVVSSGCSSCGLTVLSLLGPSTGAFAFFLSDVRVQFVIIGILLVSLLYNLKTLLRTPSCVLVKN